MRMAIDHVQCVVFDQCDEMLVQRELCQLIEKFNHLFLVQKPTKLTQGTVEIFQLQLMFVLVKGNNPTKVFLIKKIILVGELKNRDGSFENFSRKCIIVSKHVQQLWFGEGALDDLFVKSGSLLN